MKIKDFKKVCDEYAILYRGGKCVTEEYLEDLKDYDTETIHKIFFNQYDGVEIYLEDKEGLDE